MSVYYIDVVLTLSWHCTLYSVKQAIAHVSTLKADAQGELNWTMEGWRPFLEKWCLETLTLTSVIIENMAQCNTRFATLHYFPKYGWSNHKPIVCFKPKMFCHLVLVNSHDWLVTLRGRIQYPQKSRKPPTRHTTRFQSTADCRRESCASIVPGLWVQPAAPIADGDTALSRCQ